MTNNKDIHKLSNNIQHQDCGDAEYSMTQSTVLIINDITGYGRVSSFAMLPVFASYGLHPYVLPTAVVSNATDYGSCEILDTTLFMKNCIKKWSEFNFKFNNICTGFINSVEQVDIICDLIKQQDSPFVIVDPIMADSGELYKGMYSKVIECNRKLVSYADVIIPNLTEAELLADKYLGRTSLSDEEYGEIVETLHSLGAMQIVITGCKTNDNKYFNLVYCDDNKLINKCYFEHIDEHFVGTGDIFSACLTAELIKGSPLLASVEKASDFVRKVITDNLYNKDRYDLHIERCLKYL